MILTGQANYWDIKVKGNYYNIGDDYETRQEARIKSIEKANEIYNSKQ